LTKTTTEASALFGVSCARRYRIPIVFEPLHFVLSAFLAGLAFLGLQLVRGTCQVRHQGEIVLGQSAVFCAWHRNIIPLWIAALNSPKFENQVWLNHLHWTMRPVHLILYFLGIRNLIFGSTGNRGKEAADALVEQLKKGASTVVFLDGPKGPALLAKKGALHLSSQSQLPLVFLDVTMSRFFKVPFTWDGKRIPLFSKIVVQYQKPILPNEKSIQSLDLEFKSASENSGISA